MTFYVFAAILIPQFYFVWKIMPETKGLSLEEIERSWHGVKGGKQEPRPMGEKPPVERDAEVAARS